MATTHEIKQNARNNREQPMLQINRRNYVRISAKILDITDVKMKKYLRFGTEQIGTKVTNDDVIEYALNLLFERDRAFKAWLKKNP